MSDIILRAVGGHDLSKAPRVPDKIAPGHPPIRRTTPTLATPGGIGVIRPMFSGLMNTATGLAVFCADEPRVARPILTIAQALKERK